LLSADRKYEQTGERNQDRQCWQLSKIHSAHPCRTIPDPRAPILVVSSDPFCDLHHKKTLDVCSQQNGRLIEGRGTHDDASQPFSRAN
jgi:hypothetical protein